MSLSKQIAECPIPSCRCSLEPPTTFLIPFGISKLCIYVASEPVMVELAFVAPTGKNAFNHASLLHKGLNVRCLCKYTRFSNGLLQYVLMMRKTKLVRLRSAEPEILTFLALDFHEPLSLVHLATAQISTLRLSEKQLRDYCRRVNEASLDDIALPLPRDKSWTLAIAGSLSRVQRIYLKFNLSSQQLTCWGALLRNNPHDQFVNRLDLEEHRDLTRIRKALLDPNLFDVRREKDPEVYYETRKYPFLTAPVFWSNPRRRTKN